MTCSTAAGIGEYEVSSIRANGEYHIAGVIADCSIGMGVKIIEEHVAGGFGFFGRGGLLIGDFVESNYNSRVAASGIIQKETRELLNTVDAGLVEKRSQIGVGELNFLPIDGG